MSLNLLQEKLESNLVVETYSSLSEIRSEGIANVDLLLRREEPSDRAR